MAVLNFIFQDGWHFLGMIALIYVTGEAISLPFEAMAKVIMALKAKDAKTEENENIDKVEEVI